MSEAPARGEDAYIVGLEHEGFYPELVLACARLAAHGNGGIIRITRAQLQEQGEVRITRIHDQITGDIVFRFEELAR